MALFQQDTVTDYGQELLLPMMTLRDVVVFPHSITPLFVGRDSSVKAIEKAIADHNGRIFVVVQKDSTQDKPGPEELYQLGVVSKVLQLLRLPDGSIKALFEGMHRATWKPLPDGSFWQESYPQAMVSSVEEIFEDSPETQALTRNTHEAMEEYARSNKKVPAEALAALAGLRHPGRLADGIMPLLRVPYVVKQEVLELLNAGKRLAKVYELISGELSVANLEKDIRTRVKDQMERNQREYYLNEQIKAIHKEMGHDDDPQAEAVELEKRLLEKDMPEEARERGLREVRKLRQMTPSSPEYTVSRNYLDWILDLPWNVCKHTRINIKEARNILDGDHYGLQKPKERILEYLAVQKLTGALKGPILCFVGPPGVGKTSLAKSVAKATGREFVRLSLGGVRDEAEIRGHRRTYVGALPGKILMSLKRGKFNNPLFCLDEIDKMSADFRGDPSSALLEVLDPEQNSTFNDHYLDLDYDLSQIFFITTANSLHAIPEPLQDRMEIIHLSSYLETEKQRIARRFLLPRQFSQHGVEPENLRISDNAIMDVIRYYTREAGVRNLEREIASLCRKVAVKMVEDLPPEIEEVLENLETVETMETGVVLETSAQPLAQAPDSFEAPEALTPSVDMPSSQPERVKSSLQISVSSQNLHTFLGVRKYRFGDKESESQVGVCAGLAFNDRGGAILHVETALMPGSGKISTTGQLGEVMTESAQAAFSYVRSRSAMLGLRSDFHKDVDVHVHVPEGGTPKDGPSAGITLATSITSALLGIPVRHDVAMTGEITLRGRVLPIGGLREKLLAARRSGISMVIIPKENAKDLKEVPDEILKSLHVVFVEHVDEVLPLALLASKEEIFHQYGVTSFPHSLRQPAAPALAQSQ